MSRIALWVTLTPRPGKAAELRERAVRHARTCLAEEAGCERFDVLVETGQDGRLNLYEVYRNKAALQAHDESPHMNAYRNDTTGLIGARERRQFELQE